MERTLASDVETDTCIKKHSLVPKTGWSLPCWKAAGGFWPLAASTGSDTTGLSTLQMMCMAQDHVCQDNVPAQARVRACEDKSVNDSTHSKRKLLAAPTS